MVAPGLRHQKHRELAGLDMMDVLDVLELLDLLDVLELLELLDMLYELFGEQYSRQTCWGHCQAVRKYFPFSQSPPSPCQMLFRLVLEKVV